MRCPFLREAQVKSCRASAFRKMITRESAQDDTERCSSPEYVTCPAVKQHREERPSLAHCPFLQESLVQYCAAASVTKYIPYSEALLSPCGTASHRYCELFLAIASPAGTPSREQSTAPDPSDKATLAEHDVDGVKVPGWLWYSLNHFWLDLSSEGIIHIGIDGLLARSLGSADRLTFVTHSGVQFPTAVITTGGVDLQLSFPRKLLITKTNSYLRSNPSRMFERPYTLGWLFEGVAPKTSEVEGSDDMLKGLLTGAVAVKWMRHESDQLTKRAHDIAARPVGSDVSLMADGGVSTSGLMRELSMEDILSVFNDFFSPNVHKEAGK